MLQHVLTRKLREAVSRATPPGYFFPSVLDKLCFFFRLARLHFSRSIHFSGLNLEHGGFRTGHTADTVHTMTDAIEEGTCWLPPCSVSSLPPLIDGGQHLEPQERYNITLQTAMLKNIG